jgi:hypothetical protein
MRTPDSIAIGNMEPDDAIKKTPHDSSILEQFYFFGLNSVRLVHDFDGTSKFYLLDQYYPEGAYQFALFTADSLNTLLERMELSRDATFLFDTLNGGNIMTMHFRSWGTGYLAEHVQLVTIDQQRFKTLFADYTSLTAGSPWSVPPTETIDTINYVDLNRDGYLDIQENITVEVSTDSAAYYWDPNAPHRFARKTTRSFIWDKQERTFTEEFLKQL